MTTVIVWGSSVHAENCVWLYTNMATLVGSYCRAFFHLACHFVSLGSQNDKQDSEMMAVRTADKLLKVNVPLWFFYCFHWLSNWSHFFTIYPLDQSANSKLCCFKLSFKHILECLVAINCVDLWVLTAGPQRALNYILNTFCDCRY